MNTTGRLPPALCVDCAHPISERAIRCRPCAARARAGIGPNPSPEPSPAASPVSALSSEDIAWIQSNGRHYNTARLAQVFGVPVEHIRWVLDATDTE